MPPPRRPAVKQEGDYQKRMLAMAVAIAVVNPDWMTPKTKCRRWDRIYLTPAAPCGTGQA